MKMSIERWTQRKNYEDVVAVLPRLSQKNGLRGVPNNWCKLVNTQVRPCPKCKRIGVVTGRWHLKYVHGEELPHINAVWRKDIVPITLVTEKTINQNGRSRLVTISREDVRGQIEPVIARHLEKYQEVMEKILRGGSGHRADIRVFETEERVNTDMQSAGPVS